MADNKTSVKDMFLRGIAVLGLIAVLLLGAWGIIQIAVALPGFLGGLGNGVVSVFDRDEIPRATTTPATPATPAAPRTPTTPTKTSGTYAPASVGNRTNLFGYPDLSVRILSGIPYGSRYSVTFEIANYGTNVVPAGWSFVAELPMDGDEYPYYSQGQQALYPGDRIIYTLGFDTEDYNYWYDRDEDCDWDEDDDEWDCDDDNDRRNRDEEVTLTADPYGYVYELNERNNTVRLEI
jgi:hypothetical protein